VSDELAKRLFPIAFYRCHACGWRKARFQRLSVRGATLHTLSLVGYIGGVGVILGVAAGIVALTLTFLGVPMPWTR